MGFFISCREIATRDPYIGELRRRAGNVYNSDKLDRTNPGSRRNLLI
jgi:hypothetical protein